MSYTQVNARTKEHSIISSFPVYWTPRLGGPCPRPAKCAAKSLRLQTSLWLLKRQSSLHHLHLFIALITTCSLGLLLNYLGWTSTAPWLLAEAHRHRQNCHINNHMRIPPTILPPIDATRSFFIRIMQRAVQLHIVGELYPLNLLTRFNLLHFFLSHVLTTMPLSNDHLSIFFPHQTEWNKNQCRTSRIMFWIRDF